MGVSISMAEGPGYPEGFPLLPHPAEMIMGVIAFVILYFVAKKYVVPAFEKAYEDRTEAIEGGMEKAERLQEEAREAKKKYEDQLAGAHDEASAIREKAKEQGAQIVAEMREQAKAEAARITATAHKQVDAERQQAMVSLRSEVGEISTNLASRIVGESLEDQDRQNNVIERFLSELESSSADDAQTPANAGGES
ncbi:MAG TPA: F0F1 ATP synthase subunit B [Ornithinimicrobium sp.]|uniref:F0F1 ATP synthase subunit B n=1 Tax=Ornithinimicrobium sp. TaxID=1977084 RepID=UPI002B49FC28|nr:F0F1 ATP synthase subunit B [Ornithinimicrobium sp.]HKJ12836.1 F0F1 ATP synthase subunit B [Ornithinimicrobium sp.]